MTNKTRQVELEHTILAFVQEKWGRVLGPDRPICKTDSLFAEGIIDSIGVLGLVRYLEEEFDLEISPELLVLENFESVEAMARLVVELQPDV